MEGSCGTPGFNAPEQFSGEEQGYPVDIFSLGKNLILILFEWKIGWNLLWSSEECLQSQNLEHKVTSLCNLFEYIRQMMQVFLLNLSVITFLNNFENENNQKLFLMFKL